jgi:hypothetical protein
MNKKEQKKAKEWVRGQSKTTSISVPDRMDGELPITEKQVDYIRSLAKEIDMDYVRSLGKWQASSLIEQILEMREEFTEETVAKAKKKFKKRGCSSWIIIFLGIGAAVFLILLLVS